MHPLQDIGAELQRQATIETAQYVRDRLPRVQSSTTPLEVLDIGLAKISLQGLVLEFGVFSGRTIKHIAGRLPNTIIHGFDSFQGLPESWRDGFAAGHFATDVPIVPANVALHKGWFEDSIPEFLSCLPANERPPIAFLHVDCDLYSSTKTIFKHLRELITRGTVIVFDEYFNYPGWQQGEFKAFQEFLVETERRYSYLGYNRIHEQVAVVIM